MTTAYDRWATQVPRDELDYIEYEARVQGEADAYAEYADLYNQCTGFGCEGCIDCTPDEETRVSLCPFCHQPAHAKMCAEQRVKLGTFESVHELKCELVTLYESHYQKDITIQALRLQLDAAHAHIRALLGPQGTTLATKQAARAFLTREAK